MACPLSSFTAILESEDDMAQSDNSKKATGNSSVKSSNGAARSNGVKSATKPHKARGGSLANGDVPSWLAPVMSVLGVGIAVGAGLYATRHQWMPKTSAWKDDFSAAFADDETDAENFDQTRHAGAEAMRDNPGDDWSDVDDMSDASFPASDPPSFTPGTAS